MASGAEESSPDDIRNALWYIEGSLSDIYNEMRNEFDELWDIVKNDYSEELVERVKHKGGMKKKKQMTDRELP